MILAAAAALVLCACAKVETVKNEAPEAVGFSVYTGKATKAVSGTDFGTITNSELQASTKGFGVFAYYTDAADYTSSTKANFMYNQQVKYSAGAWTYSPVKYWPNEHGASATSTDTDKLTFLAYAPFVANKAIATDKGVSITDKDGSAAADEGIIAMTANNVAGDATLTFKVPASAEEQIDLLYGVLGATYVDVEGNTIGTAGEPMKNLTKQKTDGNVSILFKHALAKFVIDIKDVVDAEDPDTNEDPASDNTKVVVKSVKLKGANIGTQGDLNLYTGGWNLTTSSAEYSVPLPSNISVADAPTTYPTIAGVIETGLANKINLMLIPATATTTTVTSVEIIYYVCTQDSQLDGQVSVVENKISKTFDIDPSTDGNQPLEIVMGKQYNLNLLLGLTSIELDASVEPWTVDSTNNVDLPKNVD